jgi:hypothetical protein
VNRTWRWFGPERARRIAACAAAQSLAAFSSITGDFMKIETIAVHGGYSPDPTTKAVVVPIYQTVAYAFDNTQHGADLFDLKVPGNIYSRIMNPTNGVLEARLAAMEGGIGALAVASGMAAIAYAIQTIAEAGDNIVSASTLYGGTYNLFAHTFPQMGITVRFADPRDPAAFAALIDERTKAVYCESVGNPLGNVTDIGALAAVAHAAGVPLIVDNTVTSPYLCRPFEHGADIVVHSLTKYLGGHGTTIGGAIVDSGKFPWAEHKARFKRLNEPDVSYHGVVYTEALGPRTRCSPPQHGSGALSHEFISDPAGCRDPRAAHGPHLRKRRQGGDLPDETCQSGLGQLRRLARPQGSRPGTEIHGRPRVGHHQFRVEGGQRHCRRCAFPGCAAIVHPAGQYR